jgi:hypothetical protein
MSLGVIPFSKILLTVLFDTLTYNVSFLPEAFPFLSAFIIPLGVMVNYGDLQLSERIMVAR